MPTADPAAQQRILELAEVDHAIDAAGHRRRTLPELAVIAEASARIDDLESRLVLAQTEVGDLDRATRKLDDEIESVRLRADRDRGLLASGAVSAKELTNLQSEVESLGRRQDALEDDALELMQRREDAATALGQIRAELGVVRAGAEQAAVVRDQQFGAIDEELATLKAQRTGLISAVPEALLALYDRIRSTGKAGAGSLIGERCSACQMSLDRQALDQIRTAAADSVQRCPECGAILIRA